jgi:hypothetical protein
MRLAKQRFFSNFVKMSSFREPLFTGENLQKKSLEMKSSEKNIVKPEPAHSSPSPGLNGWRRGYTTYMIYWMMEGWGGGLPQFSVINIPPTQILSVMYTAQ